METVARVQKLRAQKPQVLERHLGYSLRRVSNFVSGRFARALHTRDTSVAEWVVLCHVQEHHGVTPGELAASLDFTRGAISKIIDKLEAKRWITHATNPEDGRSQLLSLTKSGSHVLPELAEIADRNDRVCFEGLDAGERNTLGQLLGKLVEFHHIRDVPTE